MTYEIILEALGFKTPKISLFNDFIFTQNGLKYNKSKIYVVAHPGGMGSANRKRVIKAIKLALSYKKKIG